jgi:hypothetical protein
MEGAQSGDGSQDVQDTSRLSGRDAVQGTARNGRTRKASPMIQSGVLSLVVAPWATSKIAPWQRPLLMRPKLRSDASTGHDLPPNEKVTLSVVVHAAQLHQHSCHTSGGRQGNRDARKANMPFETGCAPGICE